MSENCLKRDAVKSLAAGRYPKNELLAVRRHLAECPRCRAAVVAAASGLRGPGDTVLLKRSEPGAVPTWLKLGVFAVSVLVAGGAWRYGGALKSTDSGRPRGVQVQAPLEAASSTHREPLPGTAAVSVANPRPEAAAPSVDPAASEVAESLGSPAVKLAPPSVRPLVDDAPPPAEATRLPAKAPQAPARPAQFRSSTPRPAAAPSAPRKDEFDFGID